MRVYRGFGATSETGKDCPVPEQHWYSIPGPSEIDPWCDCMYENAAVRAACKTPIDILKPSTWGAPWTPLGKANRSLPGSPEWLNSALRKAATEGEKAVGNVISGNLPNVGPNGTPSTSSTTLPTPAGPGGPIGTAGNVPQTRFRLPVSTTDRLRALREEALMRGAGLEVQVGSDADIKRRHAKMPYITEDAGYQQEKKGSAMPLVAAGIAAFLLLK